MAAQERADDRLIQIRAANPKKLLDASGAETTEAAMFGMMRDGIMIGPMTWGMGLGMGLVAVVLVLGAIALLKYLRRQ
jgi:hypothetical protein